MLLVANFANTNLSLKMGTQREQSNEYQHDRVWRVFKNLCIPVFRTKVASALKGLIRQIQGKAKMTSGTGNLAQGHSGSRSQTIHSNRQLTTGK